MKLAHQIKIKVFSYEKYNEDNNVILDKFLQLFPFNLKDEKIDLKKTDAKGFEEKRITIFEATLAKENHTSKFLENLISRIDEQQKKLIIAQAESRLDADMTFFLRFDKEEYIKNNELILTDSGKCFHIEISVAAFPKKREIALDAIRKMFG